MEKAFVYGISVGGNNFTDRIEESKRIKLDFENGVNVILISPRRMGKTSLIKKVISEIDNPMLKIVYMDIYDCRSEYDFYNRFAETIMKSTGNHLEQVMENIKRFLVRISPKISFSPEPNSEFSVSLGITPKDYSPEEILNLPERIAKEQGVRLVVCIDEFQQIGEFTDSLTIQKRLRGVWQHHQNVSYCFFGSKKHLMEIFPKSSYAFLSVWGDAASKVYSYGILGSLHLFSIREVWQEDSRRVCRQNMPSGKELLFLCAATCMERYGRNWKRSKRGEFRRRLEGSVGAK